MRPAPDLATAPRGPTLARSAVAALVVFAALHARNPARAELCSGSLPPGLGTVTALPGGCPGGPGVVPNTLCRVLLVACGGINPITVQVRVTEPTPGVPVRGTVVIGSGGGGGGFYSSQSGADTLFRNLAAMGFRVVERAWAPPDGWITAEGGLRLESCRYATLLTWIRDSLHTQGAFVATGNSGGSGELAFALASWGRGAILDLVVPTASPPFGRMDYHCLGPDEWLAQCPGLVPSDSLDCTPACVIPPNHPACLQCGNPSSAAQLLWDSVNAPGAVFDYPATKVHMIFGRQDCTSAVPMGMLWYNAITSEKELQFVPNTPHFVGGTREGREAIRTAIDQGTSETVGVEPRAGLTAVGLRLRLGPNPSRGTVAFRLALTAPGSVSLRLYDLGGRRVATVIEGPLEAGEDTATLDPAELPDGVYFWRLRAPGASQSGMLLHRR